MSVSPAFAEVLRAGRAEFNRRHAQARHRYPGMDDEAFLALLGGPIDALVAQVAAVSAQAVPRVVDSIFDITLGLVGQRWLGPGGRAPGIIDLWLAMAQNAPQFIAQDPQRLLSATANAQVHWSQHGDGLAWSQTLITLATRAPNVDELLRAGQVAAWRHGLAHYRESALERARQLPRELTALAFGVGLRQWEDHFLDQMQADRWFRPDQPDAHARPAVVAKVGAFIGFGGGFEAPPLASMNGNDLLLQTGKAQFLVFADAYGSSLQPTCGPAVVSAQALPAGWRMQAGELIHRGGRLNFSKDGPITSAVARADTLLVTHAYTHAATVIALPLM